MTKDEALRMAIETLSWYDDREVVLETIGYCKEALAETQEPIAYQPTSQEQSVMHQAMIRSSKLVHKATPPSREWVGLSDAEINLIYPCTGGEHDFKDIARAIEMHLKEKNG